MKRIGLIIALVLAMSPAGKAQNYTRVYRVANRTALDIYMLAEEFAMNKNLAFTRDPVNDAVYMDVLIPFAGDECVKAQGLKGRLSIQAKDGKTRILMDSITYTAPEANNSALFIKASFSPAADTQKCTPQSGKLDNLNACSVCRNSVDKVNNTLNGYFDALATDYKNYLSNEIKESDVLLDSMK